MFNTRAKNRRPLQRTQLVRDSAVAPRAGLGSYAGHSLSCAEENHRLYRYEQQVKQAFTSIESCLQRISALQHEADFERRAQSLAQQQLGFELPGALLADTWIKPLDIAQLYAWCVFEVFRRMSDAFFTDRPLATMDDGAFQSFIEQCGFHTVDVSPCADGRLAHVISYVLRLPYKAVRRKSYAGAMFDIDDSVQKWVETEMLRYREGSPNKADEPTRYLKVAVYHYSSSLPDSEGCAAHGSDGVKAAEGALSRLLAFQQGVENSFCCGASIDLLLIGIDTDNDVIRIHLADANGDINVHRYIDNSDVYQATVNASPENADKVIGECVQRLSVSQGVTPASGLLRFIARLFHSNISQMDYVRCFYHGCYADIGHQERFIGMGIGFEEIQLRNLTYFAYLQTVEEGARDMDVGIKIFSGLNVARGLPIPVIIRNDYHGEVPGARDRAEARCHQLDQALRQRFADLAEQGLLHTLLMVRDCRADGLAETIGCSLTLNQQETH